MQHHAAFSPHFLGHNDPRVRGAVVRVLSAAHTLDDVAETLRETGAALQEERVRA